MRQQVAFATGALAALAAVVGGATPASRPAIGGAAPISGMTIPPGYRGWKLFSVAREEGTLQDVRAILGNDIAIRASRNGGRPFPDGTVLTWIAWSYVPLAESERAFGHLQSLVAGQPKNGGVNC
jgi:hypothetical protein